MKNSVNFNIEVRRIPLNMHENEEAILTVAEVQKHIPFTIQRSFIIKSSNENVNRGKHAHRVLNQFMVCLNGTVEIIVSDGESEKKYILSDMSEGLLVPPGYWCEQNYKNKGAILLVFCDKHYNESDYIRDYKLFKNFKEKKLD